MKTNKIKKLSAVVMLFAFVLAISSCSRKMGCPTNLSLSIDNMTLTQDVASDDTIE